MAEQNLLNFVFVRQTPVLCITLNQVCMAILHLKSAEHWQLCNLCETNICLLGFATSEYSDVQTCNYNIAVSIIIEI